MPPPKADVGSDFAAVLAAAQRSPADFENLGKDLPDGFPLPSGEHGRVIDTEKEGVPGAMAWDYKPHREVFTIFRPWESCSRCGQDLASGTESLPSVGDYRCPHNHKDEYEAILADCLSGKLVYDREQEIVQKDGVVLVSLKWHEKIPRKKTAPPAGVDGTVPEPPV